MAQLTTAVSEEEVVKHFREVLAPYVIETQLTGEMENSISPTSSTSLAVSRKGKTKYASSQEFLDKFTENLEGTVWGQTKKEVNNHKVLNYINISTC